MLKKLSFFIISLTLLQIFNAECCAQDSTAIGLPPQLGLKKNEFRFTKVITFDKYESCPSDIEPYLVKLGNKEALKHFNKYQRKHKGVFWGLFSLVGYSAALGQVGQHDNRGIWYVGIGTVSIVAAVIEISSERHLKKAVRIYNENVGTQR